MIATTLQPPFFGGQQYDKQQLDLVPILSCSRAGRPIYPNLPTYLGWIGRGTSQGIGKVGNMQHSDTGGTEIESI